MKKTYIAPEAKAYKVSTCTEMLAGSLRLNGELGDGQLVKGQEDQELEDGDNTISIWDLY